MKVIKNIEDYKEIIIDEIKNDNLIIFPTETVYGIGANALREEAVNKIFLVKTRAKNNPLIVHLKSVDEIDKYAYIENEIEKKLIDTFMPGPITIILKKKNCIPSCVTAGMDTVGIRVPSNPIANHFLEIVDVPIAAPSANISSRPSGTKVSDIKDEFDFKVNYIIDGGESKIGLESTVVKVIDNIPTILRPGFVTKEMIENIIGVCGVSEHVLKSVDSNAHVESPGMLYKHYAPNTPCLLIYSDDTNKLIKFFRLSNSLFASSIFKFKSLFIKFKFSFSLCTLINKFFAFCAATFKSFNSFCKRANFEVKSFI